MANPLRSIASAHPAAKFIFDPISLNPEFSWQPHADFLHDGGFAGSDYADIMCLHPGCMITCPTPEALDQHVKTNFGFPPGPSTPQAYTARINVLTTSLRNETHPGHTNIQNNIIYHPSTNANPYPTTSNTLRPPQPPTIDPFTNKFHCQFPSCHKTFARPGDLERHTRIHQAGPKEFDCPDAACERKGVNGFTRKDKMLDHWGRKH